MPIQDETNENGKKPTYKQLKVKTIYPDVYKEIPKNERVITHLPKKIAVRIMDELEKKNIPYSAVEKKNNVVAVTVSNDNENAFRQAEDTAKNDHIRYIHPEVYHDMPKEERFVQRMSETDAKEIADRLEKANIPYSAVVDGGNSAVTVNKKNAQIATLSRKQMREQAQAMKSKQKPKQRQNQRTNHEM